MSDQAEEQGRQADLVMPLDRALCQAHQRDVWLCAGAKSGRRARAAS